MKKQFFRVKQLADQTFSRAGKTNALSDDLQDADRKAEYIKNACQTVTKRMSACLLVGSAVGENTPIKDRKDKALKKSPEHAFATAMRECGNNCDNDAPLKLCLDACATVEQTLIEDNIERDSIVDAEVISRLQLLLENEIPSISKQKRNVNKFCLDVDSARARHVQAVKHSGNTSAGAAKAESVKEELEDCETKLEQSRDVLACEMFNLIVREADMCRHLLEFYKYRRAYCQSTLSQLDSLIPKLEAVAGDSSLRKVYGTRLEDHLRVTGRKIAYPIELCVCALLELGVDEEGLFRLAGGASKVKRMKLSLDAGCLTLATAVTYRDPHVIAGCLKSYLRDLPEPLLTFQLYDQWLEAVKVQNESERLQSLRAVLHKLPKSQFDNLRYLIRFFHLLSKNQEYNKMSPQNIAIVLAPNLIWLGQDNSGISINALNATALYSRIAELLVSSCDYFFPGDFEFHVTLEPLCNGEPEGIDNKGFDPRTSDGGMKRSQSVNSLTDDQPGSPKPVTRKKNKPVAPAPPMEKPPRPAAITSAANNTVAATATLPRPAKNKPQHKAVETSDAMTQSVGSVEALLKTEIEIECKNKVKVEPEKKSKTTVSTNTDPQPVAEIRHDLKVAKEKWLLGNKPTLPERPVIPERPSTLKPTVKLRTNLNSIDTAKNYENVSMSSNENLSGDERTLQQTKVYSIDKQIIEIIQYKRDRSRDKKSKEKDDVAVEYRVKPEPEAEDREEKEDGAQSSSDGDVVVSSDETPQVADSQPRRRNSSISETKRPSSISGLNEKPERPPKPDHFTSPSHCRTLSDGQLIDKRDVNLLVQKRDLNANEGVKSLIKHPSTSPPPPPVPAKPRAQSQGESTDF